MSAPSNAVNANEPWKRLVGWHALSSLPQRGRHSSPHEVIDLPKLIDRLLTLCQVAP